MPEPLSVAAPVIGIISFGITVTQGLVKFYTAVRDQKSNTAKTAGKLNRLLDLLETLRTQLAGRKFDSDEQDLLNNIEISIQACDEFIRELDTVNKKFEDCSIDNISTAARAAKSTRRLVYPFRQSTLQKIEEDIEETVSHLSLSLQLLEQKSIANVQDDMDDAKALLELVRADQVCSTIRDWLKAPDASVEHNNACKKRHPGTGLWLVNSTHFTSWLENADSCLWLNGFAGCGKSVLCSTAIQYAFRHRRSSPHIGLAFFYFVFNNESKQDASAMLRALVLQLSSQLKDNSLLSRLRGTRTLSTPPDQALGDCLGQLICGFDRVYILLDALDESPRGQRRDDVLQALVDLRHSSDGRLHLLVTSRNEPDIRNTLRNELNVSDYETLSMKNENVDRDIAAFISQSLRDNRKLSKWKDCHDQIEAKLTERAKGV